LTRETEVTGAIVAQDKQLAEVNNRLQEISVVDPTRGAGEAAQEKAEVLEQINEERAALNACRKVLEGLLSKTQERTGISVTNVRMSEGQCSSLASLGPGPGGRAWAIFRVRPGLPYLMALSSEPRARARPSGPGKLLG
jgi:hypothetical protein